MIVLLVKQVVETVLPLKNSEINNSTKIVLLQTAKANISPAESADLSQGIQARALFDSYSQNSFITERLRNKLNLKKIRKEKLMVKTFSSTEHLLRELSVVAIKV